MVLLTRTRKLLLDLLSDRFLDGSIVYNALEKCFLSRTDYLIAGRHTATQNRDLVVPLSRPIPEYHDKASSFTKA